MNYFDEYVKQYDMNDNNINYKYYHSIRVMDNMILLAKNMNLPKKDITLAKYIGLLHDIGRFEQCTKYNSYNDNLFDHGDYGSKILKEQNFLVNFDIDKSDYEVVYKAIKYHNKFKIDPNLNNRELLFAKMIRDADKLDILYALGEPKYKDIFIEDDSAISEHVKKDFYNNKMPTRKDDNTINDDIIILFSFIYDINYNIALEIIKSNKYYDKIYQRLKNKKIFKPYLDHINNYMDERIG